jgi:two-component system, response regulator PdtaR
VKTALRVVVATDESISSGEILALSERAGLTVVGEGPTMEGVVDLARSRSADLVLIVGAPELARRAAMLPSDFPALVLMPDERKAPDYSDTAAYGLVSCETSPAWIASAAALAVARARDLSAAERRASMLADQLEARKLVERAKGVIMKRLGLSEDDAYRRLQKASQDENRKLREIAESVLRAEKVFGLSTLKEPAKEPAPSVGDRA